MAAPSSTSQSTQAGLQGLIKRRPSEVTTAATGGIGLILAALLDADQEVQSALIFIVAALPALVSYIHDVGRGKGAATAASRSTQELAYTAARAIRRARLGDPGWEHDRQVLTALTPLVATAEKPATKEDKAAKKDGSQKSGSEGEET